MRYLFILLTAVFMVSCGGDGHKYVLLETEYGNMKIKLYNDTPQHRDNFVQLAKEGFYDDLLFHRIINGFMIQGGDPESKNATSTQRLGTGGPGYRIPAEIGRPHIKGALAAARTGGASNPEKESSGSQFYIVQGTRQSSAQLDQWANRLGITYTDAHRQLYTELGGTPQLDMEYTVFGEVVEGLDVIDKIAGVKTGAADRPVDDVPMKISMTR